MPGKPDFTGNSNISEQTLNQLDVGITSNEANQLDVDVDNFDLVANNGYSSSESNISGADEVVVRGTSAGSCSVKVHWTDGNGNILYTNQPSEATNTTDFNLLYPTGSTHVQIEIVDESGNTSNNVDATVNAH